MATESSSSARKVVVHFRATGGAPILRQAKFKISGTDKFAKVIEFLCRHLGQETLFVYVNSAFSPNRDELVIDLYNEVEVALRDQVMACDHELSILYTHSKEIVANFGFDGKLIVNYACSMAWG